MDMIKGGLYPEAFGVLKQAAEGDKHTAATYNFGMCHFKGMGAKPDLNKVRRSDVSQVHHK